MSEPDSGNSKPPEPSAHGDTHQDGIADARVNSPAPLRDNKQQQALPTGRVQRLWRMSTLSTQVSASTVGQRLKGMFQSKEKRAKGRLSNQIKNAERMVETMGNLKGAVMKIGQMVSLNDGEGMPPEVAAILGKLQNKAPTIPYERVRQQFIESFDVPPEALYKTFSKEPMAAASLGQVHHATLPDGREVAVKVQYPGVAKTIQSDLKNLKAFVSATGMLSNRFESEGIVKEIQARLLEEVDYLNEALNMQEFRRLFADDPRVVVPEYFPPFSSETIITMELLQGVTLPELLERGLDQDARNRLGVTLFDIFMKQLLGFQTLHADPHHGNFLFMEDGRVGLLDFGCVKRFDDEFITAYRALAKATLDGERGEMVPALVNLDFLRDDSNPKANRILCDITELFLAPFGEAQPFDFGDSNLHDRGKDIPKNMLSLGKMTFPPDALFLNRVFIGQYFQLRTLKAKADWRKIIWPHVTGEGRLEDPFSALPS